MLLGRGCPVSRHRGVLAPWKGNMEVMSRGLGGGGSHEYAWDSFNTRPLGSWHVASSSYHLDSSICTFNILSPAVHSEFSVYTQSTSEKSFLLGPSVPRCFCMACSDDSETGRQEWRVEARQLGSSKRGDPPKEGLHVGGGGNMCRAARLL